MTAGRGGPGAPSFSGRGGGRPTSLGPRDQGRGRCATAPVLSMYSPRCSVLSIRFLAANKHRMAHSSEEPMMNQSISSAHVDPRFEGVFVQNNDLLLSSSRGQGKWKKTLNGTGGGRGQHKNNGNYFGAKGEQLQGPAAPSAAVQKVSLMPCPVHRTALAA